MIRVFLLTFIFSSMQVLQAQSTMTVSGAIYKVPGVGSSFSPKVNLGPSVFTVSEPDYLTSVGLTGNGSETTILKGCDNNSTLAFKTPKIDDLGRVFMQLSCAEVDKYKEIRQLDPQLCLQLASCLQTKMKSSDSDRYELLRNAREKTAQDAIAMMARTAIDPMFKFDELKKYAFEKYGPEEMPVECYHDPLTVPDPSEVKCNTTIIDKGFEVAQQICKIPDDGCQPGYSKYIADKKTEEGQTSLLSNYIKEQSAKRAHNWISEDSRMTQEIATIMTDANLSPNARVKKLMSFLDKNHNDLDPVFRSYFEESNNYVVDHKTDEVEEGMLKYIKLNGNKATLEVLVDLERLRKVKAHELLKEQCPKVMTVKNLCKIASDVMIGAEIVVPTKSFEKLLAKNLGLPKNPHLSKSDMVQYVARCNTFVLDSSTVNSKGLLSKLGGDRDLFTANDGLFASRGIVPDNSSYNLLPGLGGIGMGMMTRTTYKVDADGSVSRKEGTYSASSEQISSTVSNKSSGSSSRVLDQFANNVLPDSFKKSDYKIVRTDKVETPDVGTTSSSKDLSKSLISQTSEGLGMLPSQAQQAMMGNNLHPINPVRNQDSIIDTSMSDFSTKPDAVAKSTSGNSDYNQLVSKIAGLEDKLAQSQKKNATSPDSEVKVDSKSQEESDLIKELRNAKKTLSDLGKDNEATSSVSSSAIKSDAKNNIKANAVDSTADASIIGSASSSTLAARGPASNAPAAAARSNAESSERSPGAPEEARTTSVSARASSSGSGESSSSANGENIVLTRLDGISHSKVNETINNMITAEAGKPFYIEEGGMVKQIVPEVVDGKVLLNEDGTPIYKKIVKGKVGQFKIDSKDKTNVKKEIAKASSPADVKMQDYQVKTPAVRYKELQEAFILKK